MPIRPNIYASLLCTKYYILSKFLPIHRLCFHKTTHTFSWTLKFVVFMFGEVPLILARDQQINDYPDHNKLQRGLNYKMCVRPDGITKCEVSFTALTK